MRSNEHIGRVPVIRITIVRIRSGEITTWAASMCARQLAGSITRTMDPYMSTLHWKEPVIPEKNSMSRQLCTTGEIMDIKRRFTNWRRTTFKIFEYFGGIPQVQQPDIQQSKIRQIRFITPFENEGKPNQIQRCCMQEPRQKIQSGRLPMLAALGTGTPWPFLHMSLSREAISMGHTTRTRKWSRQ